MESRRTWITLLALAAAVAAGGCPGDEGDTITYYEANVGTGNFPGTPIQENNLAADGRAFSADGEDLDDAPRTFVNGSDGTAIILFHTSAVVGTREHLWASYFDGARLTPPVTIAAESYDVERDFTLSRAFVMWLETAGLGAAEGGARDGDAVILFRRLEREPTTASVDYRLYSAYFDRSVSSLGVDPDDPNVRWGFDTAADLVDTDTEQDVEAFGALSDSWFSEFFGPAFANGPMHMEPWSGDATTFAGAFWTKDNGTGGEDLYTASFDLSDANADDTFSAEQVFTPATPLDADDHYFDAFWVHNGWILYVVDLENEGPGDPNHDLLECARWNPVTGRLDDPLTLSRVDPAHRVHAELSDAVFGADAGVGRLYVIWKESGFISETGGSGLDPDRDVMLAAVDPAGPSVERAEIDHYAGSDVDPQTLPVHDVRACISRDAGWIGVGWLQEYADTERTSCLFMQIVQTVPPGGPARDLEDSVLPSPVRMNSDYQSVSDEADVLAWEFQDMLMCGIGFQSDLDRMHVLFVQEPDSIDDDNYQLRTAPLGIVRSTVPASPPSAAAGSGADSDTLVWENDWHHAYWSTSGQVMEHAVALDAGSGGIFVYFIGDGDGTPLDEGAPFDENESRLFLWDGASAVEISGDGEDTGVSTLGFPNARQVHDVRVVPTRFVMGQGAHAASLHHVFISEARGAPGSATALRHRRIDVQAGASGRFLPLLTEQPAGVDTGEPGDVMPLNMEGPPLVRGDDAAVFFLQNGHLYYNEWSDGTWYEADGLPHPEIVDDCMETEVPGMGTWCAIPFTFPETGPVDLLSHTMIFFTKQAFPDPSEPYRLFVRIRN